jgi:hypothetical protein
VDPDPIYQYDLVQLRLAPLQLIAGDPRHTQHPCHESHVDLREEKVLVRSVLLGLLELLHNAVAGPEEILEPLLFLHTFQTSVSCNLYLLYCSKSSLAGTVFYKLTFCNAAWMFAIRS